MIRRLIPLAIFALLLVGSVPPILLRSLLPGDPAGAPGTSNGVDRQPLRESRDPLPGELARFLEGARARTAEREPVLLMFAGSDGGYSYAYWRASYVLAGRRILPPASLLSKPAGDAIVAWGEAAPGSGWREVWRLGQGSLWRRAR